MLDQGLVNPVTIPGQLGDNSSSSDSLQDMSAGWGPALGVTTASLIKKIVAYQRCRALLAKSSKSLMTLEAKDQNSKSHFGSLSSSWGLQALVVKHPEELFPPL